MVLVFCCWDFGFLVSQSVKSLPEEERVQKERCAALRAHAYPFPKFLLYLVLSEDMLIDLFRRHDFERLSRPCLPLGYHRAASDAALIIELLRPRGGRRGGVQLRPGCDRGNEMRLRCYSSARKRP